MTNKRDARRQLCGDNYGYALWVLDNPVYEDRLTSEGIAAYARWLRSMPTCGHKRCADKRERRIVALEAGSLSARAR